MSNIILTPKTGTQVGNAVIPQEGPVAVPYNLNFALSTSYTINVRDLLQTGPGYPGLSRIQSLWIDNSQNTAELILNVTQTNQFIYVPPQSQGYYSVLSPNAGQINISTSAVVTSLCYLTVLNFPVSGDQWYPYGAASGNNTYTGGNLNTLDATLAAIKGSETTANAIPVYTVNSGGSSIVTCLYNGVLSPSGSSYNPSLNLIGDPNAPQAVWIAGLKISLGGNVYNSSSSTKQGDYISLGNYNNGIRVAQVDFIWPDTQGLGYTQTLFQMNFSSPVKFNAGNGIYYKSALNGSTLTLNGSGGDAGLNVQIYGYIA
jgi:hypothetical protein